MEGNKAWLMWSFCYISSTKSSIFLVHMKYLKMITHLVSHNDYMSYRVKCHVSGPGTSNMELLYLITE